MNMKWATSNSRRDGRTEKSLEKHVPEEVCEEIGISSVSSLSPPCLFPPFFLHFPMVCMPTSIHSILLSALPVHVLSLSKGGAL